MQSIKNLRRKVADTRSVRNKLKQKEQVVKEREAGSRQGTSHKTERPRNEIKCFLICWNI